jgi:outer membrane autotransporter protein
VEQDHGRLGGASLSLYATKRLAIGGVRRFRSFSVDNYRQTLRTSMLDGTPVKGDFSTVGCGVSVESGHRLESSEKSSLFIEPQLQLAYYRIGSENYTLSSGMTVWQGSVDSLTGRRGRGARHQAP